MPLPQERALLRVRASWSGACTPRRPNEICMRGGPIPTESSRRQIYGEDVHRGSFRGAYARDEQPPIRGGERPAMEEPYRAFRDATPVDLIRGVRCSVTQVAAPDWWLFLVRSLRRAIGGRADPTSSDEPTLFEWRLAGERNHACTRSAQGCCRTSRADDDARASGDHRQRSRAARPTAGPSASWLKGAVVPWPAGQ